MLLAGLAVLLFAIVLIVVVVARWYSGQAKQKAQLPKSSEEDSSGSEALRALRPLVRALANLGQNLPLLRLKEHYAHQIERAGLRFELSADEFLAIKAGVWVIVTAVAILIHTTVLRNWTVVAALSFMGFILPDLRLSSAVRKQEHDCLRALPGFLDLLALSAEAGMGFDSAVLKLTETLEPGPLIRRFRGFLTTMNVGKTRSEALKETARKMDLPDFTAFANAVIQATETGASLAPILRTSSIEMMARRFERAEKAAHELPVKILLPLFVFVFPATFLMILVPVYFQFVSSGAAEALR